MKRTLRLIFSIAFALVLSYSAVSAQSAVVLLKGNIVDNASGAKVELTFQEPGGKAVRASSGTDGSYQTVLKSGTHYNITVTDDNLQRFTFQIDTPKTEKYSEMKQDFSLKAPLPVAENTATKASKKKTKAKKSTKGK